MGIHVTAGSVANLEATLWGNDTDWQGPGTIIVGTHNYWGDPAFVDPDLGDYHLRSSSAAIDWGVFAGVTVDFDGEPRPMGAGYDLGADEFQPLAAPTLLPISNPDGNGDYLVDWNDVTGATSYTLQEDDNPGFATPTNRYTGADTQFQVTNQDGGTWYYRVRASNVYGDSPWSNTESVSVIPAAPLLAPISNPDGDGTYLTNWNDVTGATSYTLEEDEYSSFPSPTVRYQGSVSQYQVTGQPSGTWYYRVRAGNGAGDGPWSNVESASVAPPAPILLPIENLDGDGEYLIAWSTATAATSYTLEEDDTASFASPTVRYQGDQTQFQVSAQGPGDWYYRVKASNLGGSSPWSNVELAGVRPAAPNLYPIANSDGDGTYLVDWSDAIGATAYELQEDDNVAFTSPTVRYAGANSQYQVSGQQGGTWYYRVQAGNAGGNSPWSNTESVGVIPAAPVLLPISNPDGNGDYLVDWNDVTGALSYRVEEDDNSAFTSPMVRYEGDSSQYAVSGQQPGLWYYRVRAINATGDGPWSNVQQVSVIPEAPLLAPISNPDGNGDYLVDWNDVTGATSYWLEEDDNSEFTSPTPRYNGTNSQYQVSEQPTGLWYYRVRATCAGGDSAWSNTESVSVAPSSPVLFPISNPDGNGDYLVHWSDVTGATSYRLEEDDNSAFTSPTPRYTGASNQFQVYGQESGTWYYRVRASNSFGDSSWSNTESVSVIPAAPVLFAISNPDGNGQYLVDWSDVTGATGYELEEDDNAGFDSPVSRYQGIDTQFDVIGQQPGVWHYRVRAFNAAGFSPWSPPQAVVVVQLWRVCLPLVLRDSP